MSLEEDVEEHEVETIDEIVRISLSEQQCKLAIISQISQNPDMQNVYDAFFNKADWYRQEGFDVDFYLCKNLTDVSKSYYTCSPRIKHIGFV